MNLEKCEETIQFSMGYFSLEERIKLFKRVDEFNLWDKLDLYNTTFMITLKQFTKVATVKVDGLG